MEATAEFFRSLPERAPKLLGQLVTGSIRFDLTWDDRIEHWYVVLDRGRAEVSHEVKPADLIWECSVDLFDRLAIGASPVAALTRNDISIQGDLDLFHLLKILFPSPPGTRDPRDVAREQLEQRRRRERTE